MTWQIFTTMDQVYYDAVGREMLHSWLYHWPKEQSIVIYTENSISLPDDCRITTRDWKAACQPWYDEFCKVRAGNETKFAKKGLVWCDLLYNFSAPKLLWLDADVLTVQPMSLSILDNLLNRHLAALFDNSASDQILTVESGVVMINTKHKKFDSFRNRYRKYYHDLIMPERATRFFDGEVLGNSILPFRNHLRVLNQDLGKRYGNPLKHVPLGQYLRHFKGRSKHHHDNLEDYWRNGIGLEYNPLLVGQDKRQYD